MTYDMTHTMKRHIKTSVTARALLMTLVMLLGATGVWAQTDYSGTYFIANGNGYSSSNVANNFYLVPATNSNYDTGQPHLTTSKTGQVLNSCWKVVQVTVGENEYYRFIHVADGKYLTANPAMDGTSGNDVGRLRVHLQEFADIAADIDGNTLFNIVLNSKGGYNIRHKDMSDIVNKSTTTYLDPAGGNVDGTNLTSVRTASTSNGKVNVGGGIGYWTDEAAARWQFEEVPQNNTYTYNIVDRQGNIAIKYTTGADQPAAKALSSYTDIPAAIRSPYLNGETVKFYTFSGAFDADNLTDENKIAATPVADNANIYVTYTTDHLSEKFLRLQGKRAFNIDDGGCIFDNSGSLGTGGGSPIVTTTTHLWYISGNDPYAVQIKNLSTGKFLVSSALPTLSLAATATNFILMEESADANAAYEPVSLMVATGTGTPDYTTKAVNAYPVNSNVTYHLIDKAGNLIVSEPSTSSELALPDKWVSPLVSEYQYYKDAALSGTAVGSSCDFTGATTVTSPFEVGSGGDIYVTYDVSNAIDITGGKSYLLKFSDGVSFNQENGSDGINNTSTKAVYPYNNGDFNLYVYGQEEWVKQLANGASTRTRWLWKIVSSHNGMLLTGSDIDPYHVVIKSHQNQSLNSGTYAGSTYLRTYKPNNEVGVITGVTYENKTYPDSKPDLTILSPTEYMILGTSMLNMKLTTYNEVEGTRQTVTNFEQYWKNNPTARDILNAADKSVGAQPVTYELSSDQKALLTAKGWHTYECWANAAPWSNTSTGGKTLANGNHWFQTISMGTGLFTVEEVSLAPQVILLDQHGWEVMRVPLTDVATLRKYDSPMVDTYYWNSTALKTTGYHKYHDLDPNIKIYKQNGTKWEWKDEEGYETYTFTSSTLAADPYVDHSEQPASVKTDFYVTYTVKSQYANAYHGAATEDAVTATPYLLKQNNTYATYGGSGTTIATVATKPSRENLTNNIEWYLKPNFNIDREMGYKYAGETGAQDDALSKDATEAAYMTNGQNGFDPYNVQIQNRAYPLRYFTANTTGSALAAGVWEGTSSTVALQNMNTKQTAAGYDQTTLPFTNATFMVVDDGNGNMRLMPRFDHGTVMQSFTTLTAQTTAAPSDDNGTGTQTLYLEMVAPATEIHSDSEITDMNGHYLLAEDFTFSGTSVGSTSSAPFTGIIDGQLHPISGLSTPLVMYANNATIRNVILDNVNISSGSTNGNVGAICAEATGSTRIYNCGVLATKSTVTTDDDGYTHITNNSSTISGSNYVGGIVGLLDGTSRVINCYSYANITDGSIRAGIVGYNNYASKYNDLKTMVMNCMFYGDIDVTDNLYPIYGGLEISNDNNANTNNRLNNYNYFLYEAPYSIGRHISGSHFNCALAAEERFLVRFEFYRHLLNSTRELAAWYATGSTDDAHSKMAKWVLDKSIAPYPILKVQDVYPSVVNYDPKYTYDSETGKNVLRTSISEETPNKGRHLGTLSVTISNEKTDGGQSWPSEASITTPSLTLNRTDKDFDDFNFNYDKVQLPYYNEVGDGNYTGNRVVTGWKITGFSDGTQGERVAADFTTTTNYDAPYYNFADRDTYAKDLYSISGRVFAQGAYFNVPTGVTGITIEPYWAVCTYLSDSYYDSYGYKDGGDLSFTSGSTTLGARYTNDKNYSINGQNQKVYTSASNAISKLSGVTSPTVYDYAVVLVGNYHACGNGEVSSSDKPFSIMSIDNNRDNEPDYSLIFKSAKNQTCSPIRYDFLNVPAAALAHKMSSSTDLAIPGNCFPKGWYEVTTTGLIQFNQLEYSASVTALSPLILMGGVVEQIVSTNNNNNSGNKRYLLFGDNVWFKRFANGIHGDRTGSTPHRPISVTGGEYKKFYLSGYFRPDAASGTDNAECYIDGGKFGEVAGAGQEQINGNVNWYVNHADIDEFYGGGINESKPILGNITSIINNSRITQFCGGPKFGNMSTDKTVITTANSTTFGSYFGAGYGGNSIYLDRTNNEYQSLNYDWADWVNNSYDKSNGGNYRGIITSGKGIAIGYEYEFFPGSSGNVARLYIQKVSFSLAQTNNVTSTLTGCKVLNNFYGGGKLGKVAGNVTSTLTDCNVLGNVFGAGYSATMDPVAVLNLGGFTPPKHNYNQATGIYELSDYPASVNYTWKQVNSSISNSSQCLEDNAEGNHYIKTTVNLGHDNLGSVSGAVNLTITGGESVIGTAGDNTTGNVFGGGDESAVNDSATPANASTTVTISGGAHILGDVFGGGNNGNVSGSTTVNIQN